MEGGAIGHVCYMNKVPFAIIRSISDDFKFNKPENYEEFSQLAADRTVKGSKSSFRWIKILKLIKQKGFVLNPSAFFRHENHLLNIGARYFSSSSMYIFPTLLRRRFFLVM